ncbi:MAG: RNA polymerase sigma factor RpoD/SigA [Gemmatimonadetes bacterium]|nr:RNA polymerase sigma factor RpoD/SigA [Gemmatimonadota bacterium]MBT4611104.1 RNA polymerase sigma factor RpoD/SigA [Gemmatimonadota bacterium]MBT5056862.1 RNA polymerase sigma factor RpoD/SigA [Gemmatimonadota bacterium]MBT5144032.1 RNA polymerase sigma factor RpoD/SigA [Gemmatimonadota bacterium]MBT5590263.1 RNA polymerase sigma factor RpoD/SigA [Gemmatimonadota bacterium]
MNYESWTDDDVSLHAYFSEIASSTPLSRAKEAELADRIADGDNRAREELAEANLLFVVTVAKQYRNRGLSFSELISAGNLGLMTAVDRFDATRGFKFISYAVWWIRQAIQQALAEDSRTVRLPLNRLNLLRKIARTAQQLGNTNEGEADDVEIAKVLEVPVAEVRDTMLNGRRSVSLDRAAFDEDEGSTLMKRLADEEADSPDETVTRMSSQRQLQRVLTGLDEREHEIIQLYFGLDGSEPMTLEQIGDRMSLTRERIRQLKERAFGKLRHPSHYEELRSRAD